MSSGNLGTFVLRVGIALVYLWFGVSQFIDPQTWITYIPDWATKFGLSSLQVLYVNASFEVLFGTLLILGIATRLSALILGIHLALITYDLGYNEVAVRDFGLTMASIAIALMPNHPHTIDAKYLAFLRNKFPGFAKAAHEVKTESHQKSH